ncbi:MAG: hypothetical protein PUB10_03965 [Clostridiales bacterium]|nr:hypothetical protein [Clostridiales bacterium]
MKYVIFALFLFLYIFDSKTILSGVSNGLILWYKTLVPALAPFLLYSSLLKTYQIAGNSRHRLFYPVFLGIFSGFPAGARIICDCIEQGNLSKEEGQWLLPLCNNPSMGYCICLLAPALGVRHFSILVWLCMIGSGLVVSLLLFFYHKKRFKSDASKKTHPSPLPFPNRSFTSAFDDAVIQTAKTLLLIAGYVTCFTTFGMFLARLSVLPVWLRIFLQSIMEITTGTLNLKLLPISKVKKTILGGFANGLGGLSSLAQTASIISHYELSWSYYFLLKLLQSVLFTFLLLLLIRIKIL